MRRDLETPLTALMAMTGVVLLIACANISGLLMARAASRAKEISICLAIGASRVRIVRQLLAESMLLAVLGGLAGVLVASWTINLMVAEMGDGAERLKLVTAFIDTRVLGFAFAAAVVTCVLFGLLPARHASRGSLSSTLKTGAAAGRVGQVRLCKTLVTAQVALGLVLVTASGLFLRTLENLRRAETGFRTDSLIHFNLNAGLAGYDRARSEVLFGRILEDLRSLPGVGSATPAISPVLSNARIGFSLDVEGYTHGEREGNTSFTNAVAPGYFAMLGIPLVRGRDFAESDTAASPRVAIVNEVFVRKYFPDRDPLGRKIRLSWGLERRYDYEIVGVSRAARVANLRNEPERNFFMPYTQWDVLSQSLFYVRPSGEQAALTGPIRELVKRHDPNVPVVGYRTIDEQIDRLLRPERLVASLSLVFGLLLTAQTDSAGRFVFAQVPPGEHGIVRVLNADPPEVGSRILQTQVTRAVVKAGETTSVTVGGLGRPVIGRVVVGGSDTPINWKQNYHTMELKLLELQAPSRDDLVAFDAWQQAKLSPALIVS